MRHIIFGDLHGCIEEMHELIDKLKYLPKEDVLWCVGDLVDRGPDSKAVIELCRKLEINCVKGNHDDKHVRWWNWEKTRGLAKNPVQLTLERIEENKAFGEDNLNWLASLPATRSIGDHWLLVHAGFETCFSYLEQDYKKCMIVRYTDVAGKMAGRGLDDKPDNTTRWACKWKGPENVIYGHAVYDLVDPIIDKTDGGVCYGIDTGCCFGGRLTAMTICKDSGIAQFTQVQAKKAYAKWHPSKL